MYLTRGGNRDAEIYVSVFNETFIFFTATLVENVNAADAVTFWLQVFQNFKLIPFMCCTIAAAKFYCNVFLPNQKRSMNIYFDYCRGINKSFLRNKNMNNLFRMYTNKKYLSIPFIS